MSDRQTIDRWLRDRARTTPDRVAIDYHGRAVTYAELEALGRASPRRSPRGPRARRPRRDAHGQLAGARRCLLRLREGGADARAAQLAARRAGARVPARRRGAGALPRRGRVRRPRDGATGIAPEPLAAPDARVGAGAGQSGRATTIRCSWSTRPGRPASRRARCSRTRTASGRTSASTSRPACQATTSCSRSCRSSTAAAGTFRRCSRGGRARASCSSATSTPTAASS